MSETVPNKWELSTLESNARLITDGAHASPPTYENGRPIGTVQNMLSRAIDVSSCRLISKDEIGMSTVQSRAVAGMANGTGIFCLPGSFGACRTGWENILKDQFDSRTRPCNFVPHFLAQNPSHD